MKMMTQLAGCSIWRAIVPGLVTLLLSSGMSDMLAGAQMEKAALNGNDNPGGFVPNPIMTLFVKSLAASPHIDGDIEESWYTASARFDNFSENFPNERQRPKARTEGFIAKDDKNLYVAFICYDPDMRELRASLSDRDRLYQDDFVGINVDPFGAQLNGFEFFVNPLGIQADLSVDVTGYEDDSFDAVWESAARIYEDRWTAEFKIPFKSLRFPNKPDQDWLIHLYRIYPRENRYVYSWMPTSRDISNQYSQAGHLKMEMTETSGRTIEVLPYAVGTAERSMSEAEDGRGTWSGRDYSGDAGFNLKYGLTSNITLDLAYNPDFSQIEADAGQISVNNPFALFYNEKRPFFLEGRDIFYVDSDINLMYTRTINDPLVVGKISGKSGRLSFGMISGFDENTPYTLPFEESSQSLQTTRNSTSHILRTKYELGTGTYVGFTGTDRRGQHGSNSVGTLDTKIRLDSKYTLSALASLSHTNEPNDSLISSNEYDLLDFEVDGTRHTNEFDGERFNGRLFRVTLDRTARHWGFFAWFNDLSPGYRSENGFIRINNLREAGAYNRYTFYFPESHKFLARVEPRVQFNRKYNYDGKLKDWWINPQLFVQFKNQTYIWSGMAVVNNENYRGRQFNNVRRIGFEMGTQVYKKLYGGFWTEVGRYINRGGSTDDMGTEDPINPLVAAEGLNFQTWITMKPTSRLSNEIEYRQFHLWTEFGGRLITSQRILRSSLAYQFTKRLFLRIIGELAVRESNSTLTEDGVFVFDSEGRPVEERDASRSFRIDPLLSYKINPFTVFFVGGSFGGGRDPYPNYDGYTVTDQNIFVKFQYFVRL